jgi:hypothetical protein
VATIVNGVFTAVAAYLAYLLLTRLTEGLRRREFRSTPGLAPPETGNADTVRPPSGSR